VREFLQDGPECTFSIIIETKNLHIESKVETAEGQRKFGSKAQQVKRYLFGSLTTHRLEKQDQAAEFATLCPER